MKTITYNEHLEWCKERALSYIDTGDLNQAFISMVSDLRKQPITENHPAIQLGISLLINGDLNTSTKMRKFIKDFN